MEGYEIKIIESSQELSARDRLRLKDLSNAISLDREIKENESLAITPTAYVILAVHNEKSDNKDYKNYVISDDVTGHKYYTGSESFFTSFRDIWEEMKEEGEYQIEISKKPSKNYTGK